MQLSNNITILAAAEWWEILGGLILFLLYGLGQLMSARDEGKKRPEKRPVQPPQPRQLPAGGGAAPPNQADPLRAEVEEFLRRAQGKPAAQRQPQPAPPPRKVAPPRPQPQARKPSPPLAPRQAQPEVVLAPAETVAEHVARSVDTRDISAHLGTLGADVALADDRMEARLQEKFQHSVGHLGHTDQPAEVHKRPRTIAEEFRQLISQPAGMRHLIIANEILRRPEERW